MDVCAFFLSFDCLVVTLASRRRLKKRVFQGNFSLGLCSPGFLDLRVASSKLCTSERREHSATRKAFS